MPINRVRDGLLYPPTHRAASSSLAKQRALRYGVKQSDVGNTLGRRAVEARGPRTLRRSTALRSPHAEFDAYLTSPHAASPLLSREYYESP